MDAFQTELIRRLPLAQATLALFDYAIDGAFLQRVFQANRGRCYEDTLKFPSLVQVIRDALLVHEGSGNKSITAAKENGVVEVHPSAVYRKLGNLPEPVSQAMLREGTTRLGEVMARAARTLPPCVGSMQVIAIDGKELKKLAKRLKAARKYTSGSLLGGKLLVALSLQSDLAVAMSCKPDGEANEVPLVPDLVGQVRELISGSVLWMADRQYTDLDLFQLFTQRQDHFLIRCRRGISFEPDPSRPPLEQKDAAGRRVVQEWGWLGGRKDKRRRYVRRITLYREGEDDVVLVTDLLEEQIHPGLELLELYLQRWGIERCFQQVTEIFGLQKMIGSTPRAAIFQSAFCFLLYNVAQVVRSYAAASGDKAVQEVSIENVFYDTTQELICWSKLGDEAQMLVEVPSEPGAMRQWLTVLLACCWKDNWIKRADKKPRAKKKRKTLPGGHGSLWKLMYKAKHPHTTFAHIC
jgi:hypothetical protein